MSANDRQVGGSHYHQEGAPQHWDIVRLLGWDYYLGAATKYLWRLGKKGGPHKAIEDISKAIHFLWRLGRKGDEAKKLEDVEKAIHYLEKKAEQLRAELAEGDATRNYVDQG